ncbi:AMP-binding protein [Agilicoccus flavus]|uniref:AMP-binding protein n=1 Tax=Agilicoccus flavus TaxID=2775968 RepID=UPI001CF6732B|nr:AMP-binding protein [Agilicoccus flavus]
MNGTSGRRDLIPLSDADAAGGVVARFRTVVGAIPDAVAVTDSEGALTYADLAAQAAAVRAGVDRRTPADAPVAVLFGHTTAAVAAILGVIASGRPLLVLDARTPGPRLAQFVERAGARLVLAADDLTELAGELGAPTQPWSGLSPAPAEALWDEPVDPAGPAVLAFTSGSTGVPKIVVNDQRMLVADAWDNSIATGCYDADDVIAHTLPTAFHAGLMVTVAGLVVGSEMRLYDSRGRGIGGLAPFLVSSGATIMHTSPAILRAFVAAGPTPGQLAGLRSVTIAGEAAHGRDVEALRPLLPSTCVLRNRYGSSETGLICEYVVDADHPRLTGPLPVGTAVGHTRIEVVADDVDAWTDDATPTSRVPGSGVVTVTRDFVASGYWGNDAATAAAFTDLPDGRRRYRTSDVGVVETEVGSGRERLTLLGRRDHSVKVRGYLVEPGEVDAALFTLDDVAEALTVGVPRGDTGQYRLVSYVVSRAERPSGAATRAALRGLLPGHLVPEAVVFLAALPRTERGKLDRSALPPAPTIEVGELPITEWERLVAAVWADVLDVEEVGRHGDFFELGGDSLAAEELTERVVTDLGVSAEDVTSSMLAATPTLAEYSRNLKRRPDRARQTITELRPGGSLPPLFLVAGGGGLGVGFVPIARHLPEDQPCWALHSHALERRGLPDWSIPAAARRNIASIKAIQPAGPYYLAGHSFGGVVALEMAQQLRRAGEEVGLLIELDSFPPDPDVLPPLPPRSLVRRVRDVVGLAVTGLVPTPGLGQFWRFHAQSRALAHRYRTTPYEGRAVVVVAESEDQEARMQWGPHLAGPWTLHHTGGDHMSMLRDPHAKDVAAIITDALAQARGGLTSRLTVVPDRRTA